MIQIKLNSNRQIKVPKLFVLDWIFPFCDMVGFFDVKLETSVSNTSTFSVHNRPRNKFYSNCFMIGAEGVRDISMQRFNLFAYF